MSAFIVRYPGNRCVDCTRVIAKGETASLVASARQAGTSKIRCFECQRKIDTGRPSRPVPVPGHRRDLDD